MKKPNHPLLDSLEKDISFYNEVIKEVSEDIIQQGISKYPVFIAHEHEVKIGEPILDKDELGRDWSVNVTVLEEMVEFGIIRDENLAKFKTIFKDPKKFICVFLISEKGGNFIFIPYDPEIKIDGSNLN